MSYDLIVFEKTKAPMTKKEFMVWYNKQAEWGEDHDYETIAVSFSKYGYNRGYLFSMDRF